MCKRTALEPVHLNDQILYAVPITSKDAAEAPEAPQGIIHTRGPERVMRIQRLYGLRSKKLLAALENDTLDAANCLTITLVACKIAGCSVFRGWYGAICFVVLKWQANLAILPRCWGHGL